MKYIYYPFAIMGILIARFIILAILAIPFLLIVVDVFHTTYWDEYGELWATDYSGGLDLWVLQADFIYSVALIGLLIYVL